VLLRVVRNHAGSAKCYVGGLEGGGYDAAELPSENVIISACHSQGESKGKGGIVMGSVGAEPAAQALAGSVGKELVHIDEGGSFLVGAPHVGADIV
jgi:hypothetical protein